MPPEGSWTYWAIEATNPHRFMPRVTGGRLQNACKKVAGRKMRQRGHAFTANTLYTAEWQIVK